MLYVPATGQRRACCTGCLGLLNRGAARERFWEVCPLPAGGQWQDDHAGEVGRAEQPAAGRPEPANGGFWARLGAWFRQPPCQMCIGGEVIGRPDGCTRENPGGPAYLAFLTFTGVDPVGWQRTPCCGGCRRKYLMESREPHPERHFERWTNPPRRPVIIPSGGRHPAAPDPTTPEWRRGWVD